MYYNLAYLLFAQTQRMTDFRKEDLHMESTTKGHLPTKYIHRSHTAKYSPVSTSVAARSWWGAGEGGPRGMVTSVCCINNQ